MKSRKDSNATGAKLFFFACATIVLLISIANSASAYTIQGQINNFSNQNNYLENSSSWKGEQDATVLLNYNYTDGTPMTQPTTTDFMGRYSFIVNNYTFNSSYKISASKGAYTTAVMSRNFPENISENTQNTVPMTLTISPILLNISCDKKIVNKGDPVNCTVNIEIAPGENPRIAGIQFYPSYARFDVVNVSNEGFFSRKNRNFFYNGQDYNNQHVIYDVVLGNFNYNDSWPFVSLNMTAIKNGSDSIAPNNVKFADFEGSMLKLTTLTSSVSITWPPDINGDGNVTAADVGRINYCLAMKYTVEQCGEHTDANLDKNKNITAADLGLVRSKLGQSLVREY